MAKSKKYYVVWEGQTPGIYDNWQKCLEQVKGYPQAKYKAFKTLEAARAAYDAPYQEQIGTAATGKTKPQANLDAFRHEINWESIAVDAACSGNPGKMEYQGVHTKDGTQIFHKAFPLGTNNIGEFLAIVHALALLKQSDPKKAIYTDSRNAMLWVTNKKCKSTLSHTPKTAELWTVIRRAEAWLKANTYENPILKWETDKWGEIPADFGRK
ncbi:MAG: ribonuclease H family protein [Phaeodactylibacter sp.]|nr:ribonuclease H family protein [Phaeodactylibacter sp.]